MGADLITTSITVIKDHRITDEDIDRALNGGAARGHHSQGPAGHL